MKIKVCSTNDPQDFEKVNPNFIYNRFDLFCKENEFGTVKIQNNGTAKVVEYKIEDSKIELGLWLTPITAEELEQILFYLTKKYPDVKRIIYKNGVLPYGTAHAHNHFRIVFPETVEEMESRVSGKSRSKMRKKLRFAEEACGKMRILEYDRSNMPDEIVETFFKFKLATRNRRYNMTAAGYLDRYHVSHCYVLMLGDTVGAIRFSCEQCPVVYGENFTYNPDLKDYSLGKYIFLYHLTRMVEKKHTQLFFAGGNFEYKKHYGSIEETLYDCEMEVSELDFSALIEQQKLLNKIKRYLKQHLSPGTVDFLRKVVKSVKSK